MVNQPQNVVPTAGLDFINATSGKITVAAPVGALGTRVLTLPLATDTLVGKATVDNLTNKNIIRTITTDAADAAVPVVNSGDVLFTKGSASAHTMAAPTFLGQEITLAAGSAFAHVITATGLIDDGVVGGSKTTITLASFVGASITLRCLQAGKWMVIALNACVIT